MRDACGLTPLVCCLPLCRFSPLFFFLFFSSFSCLSDAKFDRAHLLTFLRNSNAYILEEAYELCNRQQFHAECVFLLERMGEYRAALSVLIHPLCDVRGAIAFVEEHKDDQLWQELITRSLSSPEFLSDLLEHVCCAAVLRRYAVLCCDALRSTH
jgi:hypothetical protein